MTEPQGVEAMLEAICAEVVGHAKTAVRQTHTPTPIAVVIANGRVVTISMLDFEQRVAVVQRALTEYGGDGFLLVYDGFIVRTNEDGTKRHSEALLLVLMTARSRRSTALPYHNTPLQGTVFDDPIEVPEVPEEYRSISFV